MQNSFVHLVLVPVHVALLLGFATSSSSRAVPNPDSTVVSSTHLAQATTKPLNLTIPEGIHLYGSSAQPNQTGQTYMVFKVEQDRVVGAFYMPSSSFDCFQGNLNSNRLTLNIVDSYDQQRHTYQVALDRQFSNTAANQGAANSVIGLQGYHKISRISENDQRILSTCQAQF